MFVISESDTKTLQDALDDAHIKAFAYEELDSTNDEAKRLAIAGLTATAVIAARGQTSGRGRMGRSFYSPAETGAYFSFLYTPSKSLSDAVSVTSATAVAVRAAIRELTGLECEIKWVNDLYLNGKKVCGILCESMLVNNQPQIVIGIGINLSTVSFPTELTEKAGSLGCTLDSVSLIRAIWERLAPYLADSNNRNWLNDYRMHSCVIGKSIVWVDGGLQYAGDAIGIDRDGGLVVRDSEGRVRTLRTGEISILLQTF